MNRITISTDLLSKPSLQKRTGQLLWINMLARMDENCNVFDSYSQYARILSVSEKTIRNTISEMIADGVIEVVSPNGSPKKIRTKYDYIHLCSTGVYEDKVKAKVRKKSESKSELLDIKTSSDTLSKSDIQYDFVDPAFYPAFSTWIEYKRDVLKFNYKSQRTLIAAYNELIELSNSDPTIAMRIVRQSMARQWKSLFKLQNNETNRTVQQPDTAKQSRTRMRQLATEILSGSKAVAGLYDDRGQDTNAGQDS